MKSLPKIGLIALLGGVALFASTTLAAPNESAQAELNVIQKLHAVATAENDRIRLNCLNDKLVQAKALVNIIEGGDTSKTAQLQDVRVAAENCVGKDSVNLEDSNSYTSPPGASFPTNPGGSETGGTFEPPLDASSSMPANSRTRRR